MKNYSPLISVIIPCYNAAEYIEETLGSVFRQQYKNIEIIVIDDGSTDNIKEVLEKFISKIILIETENRGASHARNIGTKHAVGHFLQYLDADDLLAEGKLPLQSAALEQSSAEVAYGPWQELFMDKNNQYHCGKVFQKKIKNPEIDLIAGFWCPPAAYLFGKTFVEKIIWNETLPIVQDARFVWDCAHAGARFIYCDKLAAYYRKNSQGLSQKRRSFLNDCLNNAIDVESIWLSEGIGEEKKEALKTAYEHVLRGAALFDKNLFEIANKKIKELIPNYAPKPAILGMLYKLFGGWKAEEVACFYRKVKNFFGRS